MMAEPRIKTLKLKNVTADAGVQPRDGLHPATVKEYAEAMKGGATFPPGRVFHSAGHTNWLSRGFHRLAAAARAGLEEMEFEILTGEREDAILDAAADNNTHGRPRTNKDKYKSVLQIISIRPDWTDREVAAAAAVTHVFVFKVRRQIQADALLTVNKASALISDDTPAARVDKWSRDFAQMLTLLRQCRSLMSVTLGNVQASTFLRRMETVSGEPLFIELPVITRGDRKEGGWSAPALTCLIDAIEQARVDHVCAACQGKGCAACLYAGFSPKELGKYVVDPQQPLDFAGAAS
jgi:hypothetical protein